MAKIKFIIIFLILGFALATPIAKADVGEVPEPGGLITPGDTTDEIKMKSERVVFEINKNDQENEYDRYYAHVVAEFEMQNLTENTVNKKLFFPFHFYSTDYMDQMGQAENAVVLVNGQQVELTFEDFNLESLHDIRISTAAGVFEAQFQPNSPTIIKVEYDLRAVNEPKSMSVALEYIMITGSNWAGSIDKGEIIFDFWHDLTSEIVFTEKNDFFIIKNGNLVWEFSNLEPDLSHNIKVSFVPEHIDIWNNRPNYLSGIETSQVEEGAYFYGDMRETNYKYPGGRLDGRVINILNKVADERGWFFEQKEDNFESWLQFDFDKSYQISALKILPGIKLEEWSDTESGTIFYNTLKRPKTVEAIFSDGTSHKVVLEDIADQYQNITLPNKSTNSLKLIFRDAYPGVGSGHNYFGIGRIEFVDVNEKVEEQEPEPEDEDSDSGKEDTSFVNITYLIVSLGAGVILGILIGGLLFNSKKNKQI